MSFLKSFKKHIYYFTIYLNSSDFKFRTNPSIQESGPIYNYDNEWDFHYLEHL